MRVLRFLVLPGCAFVLSLLIYGMARTAGAASLPQPRAGLAWRERSLGQRLVRRDAASLRDRFALCGRRAPNGQAASSSAGHSTPLAPLTQGVPDGSGGMIVAWEKGGRDVYVQRINASGVTQWAALGVPVCTAVGDQHDPELVSDGSGGAIVVWQDNRSGEDDVYAQRVNASGVPQWTTDGVAVATTANRRTEPTIVSDGAGGAIMAWTESAASDDIYAQRLGPTGTRLWGAGGLAVCPNASNQSRPALAGDGSGGAIVSWDEWRNGNLDVYAQRVSAAGAPQWTDDGLVVCATTDFQQGSALVADGAGGAVIAWTDDRNPTSGIDVYVQRLDALGARQWATDGVALCTAENEQPALQMVSDGAAGAVVVWTDFRNDSGDHSNVDLYARSVNASGAPQWTADGVAVCTAANLQYSPVLAADGSGGVFVAWEDGRSGDFSHIYAQRLNAAGVAQWTPDGIELCNLAVGQGQPMIASDGAGGAIVAWLDQRSLDWDVYAQRVNGSGVAQWAASGVPVYVDPGVQRAPACANSGSDLIVVWQEKAGGYYDVYARKFDASGTPLWPKVAVCAAGYSQFGPMVVSDGAGGALVAWSDLRSGTDIDVYAQRLNGSGVPQWAANGVALCDLSGFQAGVGIVGDGAGGAIVVWQDWRNGPGSYANMDLFAQRVNASGAPQWASGGVSVCSASGAEFWVSVAADGAGGVLVAWEDDRNYAMTGDDIYAQRVSGSGSTLWATDGVAVCADSSQQWFTTIAPDGSGGAIVAWDDYRTNGGADVYAQRIVGATGVPAWTADGIGICTHPAGKGIPWAVTDGAGGAIVAWGDMRNSEFDYYAQRVNGAGAAQWTPDGVLASQALGFELGVVIPDGSGGAILAWHDTRNPTAVDIYAQRVDGSGAPQWGAGGLAVCVAPNQQAYPVLASDGAGGAFVAWQDHRDGLADYVYLQRVSAGGAAQWAPDGLTRTELALTSASASPGLVSLTWYATGGGAFVATVYRRTPASGWHAVGEVSPDGTGKLVFEDRAVAPGTKYGYRLGLVEGGTERFLGEAWVEVPGRFALALEGARPNPTAGNLVVFFALASGSPATLELVDVSGRVVLSRPVGALGGGSHVLSLGAGRTLAPGVYLLKLTQAGQALTRKACVVR